MFCIRYSRLILILIQIILKKHGEKTDNSSIKICINKIENRITSRMKAGLYLKLLTPETMKLLGSTKCKITKDKMVKIYLI